MLTKGVNKNDSKNTILNKLPYIAACSLLYEENYKVIKTFKEIPTNNFFSYYSALVIQTDFIMPNFYEVFLNYLLIPHSY